MRFKYTLLFFLFAAAAAALIHNTNLLPSPVFGQLIAGSLEKNLPMAGDTPVHVSLKAPRKDIAFIQIPGCQQSVRLTVRNKDRDELIATGNLEKSNGYRLDFAPSNRRGDDIGLEFLWRPEPAPLITGASTTASLPVRVSVGGRAIQFNPLFEAGFRKSAPEGYVPVYASLEPPLSAPTLPLPENETLRIEFEARYANIDRIRVPGLIREPQQKVGITITNTTSGKVLKRSIEKAGKPYLGQFKGDNHPGDTIAIDLLWQKRQPVLRLHTHTPNYPLKTTLEHPPSFLLGYDISGFSYFWWWLPAAGVFFLAYLTRRGDGVFLLLLGIASFTTGLFSWQMLYSQFSPFTDPDGYGAYGEILGGFLRGDLSREKTEAWIHDYPHAHIALTPMALAVLTACGVPLESAYLWTVACSCFGALLIFHRFLVRDGKLSVRPALLAALLWGSHALIVRMCGQPSTDALGFFLVTLTLFHLARRCLEKGNHDDLALTILIILNALARPPGIAFSVFIAVSAVLADFYRTRHWSWRASVLTPLKLAWLPLLVMGTAFITFSWLHNFELSIEKQQGQDDNIQTLTFLLSCLLIQFQIWPLTWLVLLRDRNTLATTRPFLILGAGWAIFLTALLVAVDAVYLPRIYAPALPAFMLLTALAIAALNERVPKLLLALVLVTATANLVLAVSDDFLTVWPDLEVGSIYRPVDRWLDLLQN